MNPGNGLVARVQVEQEGMVVPWLFWFEIRNLLIVNERRGRINSDDTTQFLHEMSKLIADVDEDPDSATVMRMARTHELTVYDAAYLELALRRNLTLCTLDGQLIKSAAAAGVRLWVP